MQCKRQKPRGRERGIGIMCGICGFISRKAVGDAKIRIRKMMDSMEHRGPDAEGYVVLEDGKIALGHRRLSVIDLDERSNQPMESAFKRKTLVYNGEIYNYRELKEKCAYPFKTGSDTEVLLAGLEEYGDEWITGCNGMFAFACYDQKSGKLLLARDRFGIKPLYFYAGSDSFIFASEIKGILNSGMAEALWNEDAVDEYLGNRYVREPYTFFKNIYQLPAGCCITLDVNTLCYGIKKYWSLPEEFCFHTSRTEEEIYGQFREQVICAVQRRMVSDVPLGTYLSGGVDSSVITAVAAMKSRKQMHTYTIGFPQMNEFAYARQVAEKYHTLHHEIRMDAEDYLSRIGELIRYKDAPLGVPNEIPLAVMSKKLKENITVVLSGEGADELMGGYGRIYRSPFDYQYAAKENAEDFYGYFLGLYEYVPRSLRDRYLEGKPGLREEFDEKIREEFQGRSREENVFRYFHNYHVKGLLQRVDITTMYASVEARVPFLDHELVEHCYRKVPYELKLKWRDAHAERAARGMGAASYSEKLDTPKYLLRRMGLEYLPKEVVTRKKVGFPVPLNNWRKELETLAWEVLKSAEWLRAEKLGELLAESGQNSRSGQIIWMMVNVELFRRQYFDRTWRY